MTDEMTNEGLLSCPRGTIAAYQQHVALRARRWVSCLIERNRMLRGNARVTYDPGPAQASSAETRNKRGLPQKKGDRLSFC